MVGQIMQQYLVGGAVRDKLLGHSVKDRDWVVVGSTPQQMLSLGFQAVGADFPVFLHPKTKEEYALARIERKIGQGYTGFSCDASQHVTLEDDLLRRDLTINAMAMDDNGNIIDPFNGQKDLANKQLRHVSDAFIEDPLRVLRVARFAARYHYLGFTIASETLTLMSDIVVSGELNTLTAERVWQETARSLLEDNPEVYIQILRECGALKVWFPELDKLWGVPNPKKWHPEIDTGVHTLMVLQQAVKHSPKLTIRFAALVHDLGKGLTPADNWPSHRGHEKLGLDAIDALSIRLKIPNECRELALMVSEYHGHCHHIFELKPSTILSLLNRCDVWRKPQRFNDFITACISDFLGRLDFAYKAYPQADYLKKIVKTTQAVNAKKFVEQGLIGPAIKQAIDQQRITIISQLKNEQTSSN